MESNSWGDEAEPRGGMTMKEHPPDPLHQIQLQQKDAIIQELKSKCVTAYDLRKAAQAQFENCKMEKQDLHQTYLKLQQLFDEKSRLCEKLEAKNKTCTERIIKWEAYATQKKRKVEKLEKELETVKEFEISLKSSQKQKEQTETEVAQLKETCEKLRQENDDLRGSLQSWKSNFVEERRQIRDVEAELIKTQDELAVSNARIVEKDLELKKAQEELSVSNAKLAEKDQELNNSRQSVLEQIKKNIEKEGTIHQLQNKLKGVNTELTDCRSTVLTLSENNQRRAVIIRNLETQVAENQSKVMEARKIVVTRAEFVSKLKEEGEKVKLLTGQLDKYKWDLDNAEKSCNNFERSVKAKDALIKELKTERDSNVNIVSSLQKEISVMVKEKGEQENTMQQLKSEIQKLKMEGGLYEKFGDEIKVLVKWQEENSSNDLEARLKNLARQVKKIATVYDHVITKARKRASSPEIMILDELPPDSRPRRDDKSGNSVKRSEHPDRQEQQRNSNPNVLRSPEVVILETSPAKAAKKARVSDNEKEKAHHHVGHNATQRTKSSVRRVTTSDDDSATDYEDGENEMVDVMG